jgi:hypothetical protein
MSVYDLPQNYENDGQSDSLSAELPHGAFVFPAMFVAKVGRGSSGAGHDFIEEIVPETKGAFDNYGKVMLARDEHVLMPDQVAFFGDGDIKEGARFLESWVKRVLGEKVGYSVDD